MRGWDEGYAESALEFAELALDRQEANMAELVAAATELLRLKDGLRDEAYESAKPAAWERLRAAVAAATPTS
jgi:hypothetical protein